MRWKGGRLVFNTERAEASMSLAVQKAERLWSAIKLIALKFSFSEKKMKLLLRGMEKLLQK